MRIPSWGCHSLRRRRQTVLLGFGRCNLSPACAGTGGINLGRIVPGSALSPAATIAAMSDDFGAFLRSRRARLRPEDVGFAPGRSRRVPGLRREEAAALASVSVDYISRLEQGRISPSEAVLHSLARALLRHPHRRAGDRHARRRSRGQHPDPGLTGCLEWGLATRGAPFEHSLDISGLVLPARQDDGERRAFTGGRPYRQRAAHLHHDLTGDVEAEA